MGFSVFFCLATFFSKSREETLSCFSLVFLLSLERVSETVIKRKETVSGRGEEERLSS